MTRSKRIQPIKDIADNKEKEAGLAVSRAQAAVDAAERQLQELISYRAEYASQQAAAGSQDVARVQNFQAFLARLEEAIRKQREVVEQARSAAEATTAIWRERRIESASLAKVVDRLEMNERKIADRRDQVATDERASRAPRQLPD